MNKQTPAKKKDVATDRMPPQAVEEEKAVLGSILIDREALSKTIEILDEKAFYKTQNQKIYQAALALYEKNIEVDYVTITDQLERMGVLEEVGGAYYVTELANAVPSAASVEYYANIVLEKALLRNLIGVCNEITAEA